MKKLLNNYYFNFAIIILIGIIVFAISFNFFGYELLNIIKKANPIYILLAIIFVFLWQFLVGIILTILVRFAHKDYKIREGFLNVLVAALFHGITPSSSGGQVAQFYVFRKQGIKTGDAGSVLWMEFIIYQSCLTVLSLLFILFKFSFFYTRFSYLFGIVIVGFIFNTIIIVALFVLTKYEIVYKWLILKGIAFGYKIHLIKDQDSIIDKVNLQLNKFKNEVNNFKNHKKSIIICIFLCIIRLLIYYSIPFVIFMSFGIKFNNELFLNTIAMGSFVAIASSLIPIPGASGGTEAIFILMFANLFGADITAGAMMIWRLLTYYFVMFIGVICFIYIKVKKVD